MAGYIQQMRQVLGQRSFIHPAARIIIENEEGDILFVRRKDNGNWGLPAGALEANEDIQSCIRREVKEETGLELGNLEVIGISSDPVKERVAYPNGDQIQYFVIEFFTDQWTGDLHPDGQETSEVKFFPIDAVQDLPDAEWATFESLLYYRAMGKIRIR